MFHLEFHDRIRWKVSIPRSDLLRVRWLLLFQCTFIIDFISFKTAQFKNYLSYIILFFYEVNVKFMVLVNFDKFPVALSKFWFSTYNLRRSFDLHTWSMPYHNSFCWREASCFLFLLYNYSMSPEPKLILQKGAEYQSWEKDNQKEDKMNKAEQSLVKFNYNSWCSYGS